MIIETERLILRPIVMEDSQDIFTYSSEKNVGPNAGWKPHESIEETREIINSLFLGQEAVFGIVLKEIGKVVGTVGLINDPKRENPKAKMLGYAMSEAHWGKGLMTEAAKAVVNFGFEEMQLDLISCCCYLHNSRSRSVIRKCGMEFEGTLKECEVLYDGSVMDHECYSITRRCFEKLGSLK